MKTWRWIVRPFGPWSPLPRIRRRPLKVPSSSTSGMGASPHGTQCAVLQNKSGHRRTNCTLEPGCGAFGWGSGSRCGYGVVVGAGCPGGGLRCVWVTPCERGGGWEFRTYLSPSLQTVVA